MHFQDDALEARGPSRAAEYESGDEKFSDVVHHRCRGVALEACFVEAERAAHASRAARLVDAVLVRRVARVGASADESGGAVPSAQRERVSDGESQIDGTRNEKFEFRRSGLRLRLKSRRVARARAPKP